MTTGGAAVETGVDAGTGAELVDAGPFAWVAPAELAGTAGAPGGAAGRVTVAARGFDVAPAKAGEAGDCVDEVERSALRAEVVVESSDATSPNPKDVVVGPAPSSTVDDPNAL